MTNKIFRSPLEEILPKGLENILAVQALFPLARDDEMLGLPGDKSPKYLPSKHANLPNEISEGAKKLNGPKKIMAVHSLLMERLLVKIELAMNLKYIQLLI